MIVAAHLVYIRQFSIREGELHKTQILLLVKIITASISQLPSHWDNWIHILSPKEDTKLLSPEEQCTFFGCFLYTEENVSGGCRKRILGDIFVENITICK